LVRKTTEGRGDFLVAGKSQQADDGVAKGGQVLGSVTDLDLALVFAKRHIAYPVQALDSPMSPPTSHQEGRVRS